MTFHPGWRVIIRTQVPGSRLLDFPGNCRGGIGPQQDWLFLVSWCIASGGFGRDTREQRPHAAMYSPGVAVPTWSLHDCASISGADRSIVLCSFGSIFYSSQATWLSKSDVWLSFRGASIINIPPLGLAYMLLDLALQIIKRFLKLVLLQASPISNYPWT